MKKDRNCGVPYPIYPMPNPNMMPNMGMPMGMPNMMPNMMPNTGMPNMGTTNMPSQNYSTDINNQINNLEKRVTALENMVGTNTNYNPNNFQIM